MENDYKCINNACKKRKIVQKKQKNENNPHDYRISSIVSDNQN